MKKIMIATPTYDGKIDCRYADSLVKTINLGLSKGIEIMPIYIPNDALIQRARNDLFTLAYKSNMDGIFWVDADICWEPKDFFKLVESEKHFICGTYRRKTDDYEAYVARIVTDFKLINIEKDIIEVDGVGLGFCYQDRYCIDKLWNNSKKYKEKSIGKEEEKAMLFEVILTEDEITSEDIVMAKKWLALNEKIYLDISITCGHSGFKLYLGNFKEFLQKIKRS